tara:strand:- start:2661 stop:3065 length:405 start_codon:yes stop_codon:yes gene_type:complete
MQLLNLNFGFPLNESLQVGDWVFYVPTQPQGIVNTFNTGNLSNVIRLGQVRTLPPGSLVTGWDVVVWYDDGDYNGDGVPDIPIPTVNDFIMFAKDKSINTTSLTGYYADVNFVNDSIEKAELFSVGSEVFESSK